MQDITFENREQLVNLLLACPTMKDTRDTVINDLPREVQTAISRNDRPDIDVMNIVSTCLRYPNGIEKLFNVLGFYETNSIPMQQVYKIIPEIWKFNPVIPLEKLSQSLEILLRNPLSNMALQESFMTSVPDIFKQHHQGDFTILSVLKYLSNIPAQNQALPILVFLRHLAEKVNKSEVKTQLYDWIEQNTPVSDSEPDIGNTGTESKTEDRAVYLLVKLASDPNNRNHHTREFAVHIYAWKNSEGDPPGCTYERCMKEEIPGKIDEFIEEKVGKHEDIKAIEFILPCELIGLNVDQWKWKEVFGWETKLVEYYPVVTRLDRCWLNPGTRIPERFRRKWREQWQCFQEHVAGTSPGDCILWECDHKDYTPQGLYKKFTLPGNLICLMMTYLPHESSDIAELGYAILMAGIPVGLWFRKPGHEIENHKIKKNEIRQIIQNGNLADMRDHVHKRRQCAECEHDIGNHLTLLWDDPDRVLPDEPDLQISLPEG